MGNRTQSRAYHQDTRPTMKLPVSDTRINSLSEWCCAAVKEQLWLMTQPATYGAAHHRTDCSWLGAVAVIYRY